jgi:trigger factor
MAEAAETEEKKLEPTSTVEEIGPCKLKLKIEIAADRVQGEIEQKYKDLNDSVALPGFRKGHAPRNLLERKFGKAMLDDLKFELMNHAFEEVKEGKKLEPVGEPEIDVEKLAVEPGKPFAFEMTIEVRPNLDLKNYTGIKVKQVAVTVDEKDLDVVLRNFQEAKAELVPVEDQVARVNDQLTADFRLRVGDKEVDASENSAIFLTADIQFYGLELPDFHKAVADRKVGETVEFTVTLPADFPDKTYAGKEAVIRTTIKGVKRKRLPELDAEFARSFDLDSVDELREHVRKRVLREKEEAARAAAADQIVEEILKTNDFPMPEGLVTAGAAEILARMHVDLAMRGVPEEEIHQALEKEKTQSREGMAKSLRAHFILEHIAQKEKIFVTEDQVEERITQLAGRFGRWPHEMKAYLEQEDLLPRLRRQMRDELVREFLLSKAVIEEEKKA